MSRSIKVAVFEADRQAPPDIRRITLPAGSTSFSALLGIVADRIGFSVSDVLTYVDEKGDEITLSSDEELACAFDAGVTKFAAVKACPGTVRTATPASVPGQISAAENESDAVPLTAAASALAAPAAPSALAVPVPWSASLNFWVNGEAISISNPSPSLTLLEWLRAHKRITGIHVGCGEGGCGICTVSLVQAGPSGDLETAPINACLRRLCAVDGFHVVTTQGLGGKTAKAGFHAIQAAIADGNGSQCGFCTPGWVMQMYSLLEKTPNPTPEQVEQHFDGNLCRCTGYRPILTAFGKLAAGKELSGSHSSVRHPAGLFSVAPQPLHFTDPASKMDFYRPLTLAQLQVITTECLLQLRQLRLICGNTSEGVIKYYTPADRTESGFVIVDLNMLPDLKGIAFGADGLVCGASEPITAVIEHLDANAAADASFGVLSDHMRRIASVQIRSVGSWAGNLMIAREHRNFPSDMVTILSAARASVKVMDMADASSRSVSVPELLALEGNILVLSVTVPRLPAGSIFRTFKTAQRHVFAHAIVNFGARIDFEADGATVAAVTMAIGGVCPALFDASATATAALKGQKLDQAAWLQCSKALASEIRRNPALDLRHSPVYRQQLTDGFLFKLLLSAQSTVPPRSKSALVPFVPANARPVSSGTESFGTVAADAPVGTYVPKLQSRVQASGEALYPSDYGQGALWAQIVFSTSSNVKLTALDATAALQLPGVVDFITASAIPAAGQNCVCPVIGGDNADEKIFWEVGDLIPHVGAMLGVVIAASWPEARAAAKQVVQRYAAAAGDEVTTEIGQALKLGRKVPKAAFEAAGKTPTNRRGIRDPRTSIQHSEAPPRAEADLTAKGTFKTGGQRHFYMETQSCVTTPIDGDRWEIVVSDQDSNFTQLNLAIVLGIPAHLINVKVPRAGGAFGGKLTRQMLAVSACSVAAAKLGRAVRYQGERSDDMQMVAGREPITFDYTATFDSTGKIDTCNVMMTMDAGWFYGDGSGDMQMAVQWSDNCYHWSNFSVKSQAVVTDTPHATSMRAPGCMQSILAAEVVMDHIAKVAGKDVDDLRAMNFYQLADSPVTPFGDHLGQFGYNWTIPLLWSQIQSDVDYAGRKKAVAAFNAANRWVKRGIAITPVKYCMGIQYYSSGALVNVYNDGTVMVSTGGSEIGQGLNTKVILCVANALGISVDQVVVGPRETSKVPNNTATGGSGTSESSAHAAMLACDQIVERLKPYTDAGMPWLKAVQKANTDGVSLMASAWYQSHEKDNATVYATYGTAVAETQIDVITGEVRVERVDVLMDLGTQLDAAIDIGQLQGGFTIALGYLLTEELKVDPAGTQLNLGSWEYKIPSAYDIPVEYNVSLLKNSPNPNGVKGSKASAEPAMCLIPSVYLAVKNAVYAAREEVGNGADWFQLDHPLTVENVRAAIGPYPFDLGK